MKERLMAWVKNNRSTFHFCACGQCRTKSEVAITEFEETKKETLSLIDRVPTEGEMHSIKVALEQIYGAFDYDAPGFKAIRKALGIEATP